MSKVETGPAVTMTRGLLERLAEITTHTTEPPEGYATVKEISEATGATCSVIYDWVNDCRAAYVDVKRPGRKPTRYYALVDIIRYKAERGKR